MGRKSRWGPMRKIYGVYKNFCDLRGGYVKNKRQYLKGGLQKKIARIPFQVRIDHKGGGQRKISIQSWSKVSHI